MITLIFALNLVLAQAIPAPPLPTTANLLDGGDTRIEIPLVAALRQIPPGSVLMVGENHGNWPHRDQQLQILSTLLTLSMTSEIGTSRVNLGMEFFSWPDQKWVNQYLGGTLGEAAFLEAIKWGTPPFDYYRQQVLTTSQSGGQVIAINAPRSLTGRVSKGGLAGLSDDEKRLLPENFGLGNPAYFERFEEIMGSHVPASAVQRYFEAQSVWDDTMAARASEFIKLHPKDILVIIVGEFHIQYGGGLPDRLIQRGVKQVYTLSQVNLFGMTPDEVDEALHPSTKYGKRANWLWPSKFEPDKPEKYEAKNLFENTWLQDSLPLEWHDFLTRKRIKK